MYNYEYHIFRELRWGCAPDSEEKNEEAHMKSIVYDQQSSSHRLTSLYIAPFSTLALLGFLAQPAVQFPPLRESGAANSSDAGSDLSAGDEYGCLAISKRIRRTGKSTESDRTLPTCLDPGCISV